MSKLCCADPEPHRRAGRTTSLTRSANGDAGGRRPERQRATDDGVKRVQRAPLLIYRGEVSPGKLTPTPSPSSFEVDCWAYLAIAVNQAFDVGRKKIHDSHSASRPEPQPVIEHCSEDSVRGCR